MKASTSRMACWVLGIVVATMGILVFSRDEDAESRKLVEQADCLCANATPEQGGPEKRADKAAIQKDEGDREACTLAGLSVFCKKSENGRLLVYHPNGMLMYDFSADEWRKADPRMLSIP